MIQEIAFVAYPVSDMKRARRFYEETLGLKLESNFQDQWVEYDIHGGTFAITSMDLNHKPAAKGGLVAFEVDDLEAELQRLRAAGVPLTLEVQTTPVCRFAAVADPDGNTLVIHRRKS